MLKKKMVDIDKAISSSSASMIGAAAAIADPPQIAVPNPIKVRKWDFRWKTFPKIIAARKATVIVGRLIFKEDKPVEATVAIGKLNPMKIIEYCNNFLPDQFSPGREFSGKSANSLRTCGYCKGNGWFWGTEEGSREDVPVSCPVCGGSGELDAIITVDW